MIVLLQHGFPHRPQVLPEYLLLHGLFSISHSSCLLRMLPWCGHSTGCHAVQGTSTCYSMGSSTCCEVDVCFIVVLHGLQQNNLLHHDLFNALHRNLCSDAWNTSLSFTNLGDYIVVSLPFSLSQLPCSSFLTLFKYAMTKVSLPLLISSA